MQVWRMFVSQPAKAARRMAIPSADNVPAHTYRSSRYRNSWTWGSRLQTHSTAHREYHIRRSYDTLPRCFVRSFQLMNVHCQIKAACKDLQHGPALFGSSDFSRLLNVRQFIWLEIYEHSTLQFWVVIPALWAPLRPLVLRAMPERGIPSNQQTINTNSANRDKMSYVDHFRKRNVALAQNAKWLLSLLLRPIVNEHV